MKIFDIPVINTDGESKTLRDLQEQSNLLVIFFRGAWCNHCKKQLSELNNVFEQFERLDVKPVAISCDTRFKSSLLKTFLKLHFPVLSDEKFKLIDAFDLRTVYKGKEVAKPAVFLFNFEGTQIFNYIGTDYDDRLAGQEVLKEVRKAFEL